MIVGRIPGEIKPRRLMFGMSQTSLAHAIGYHIASVHKWEKNVFVFRGK
jgi:DNA-binding transcriptional regulator YiaG